MNRYGYEELLRDLEAISSRQSGIAELGSIGKSVLGKEIPFIQIGRGAVQLHVNAGMHANEWLNVPCLMQFVNSYLSALEEQKDWHNCLTNRWHDYITLWVVPMLNPDGVNLVLNGAEMHPLSCELLKMNQGNSDFSGWKANIRGIDLNDQFPAHFYEEAKRRSVKEPGPRDYGGDCPLTEPESRALAEWTMDKHFDATIALHSQGEEIYWNYRGYEPEISETWAEQLALSTGYNPVKLMESDAGYKDWFIQKFGRPGFTIETGLGVNPLPISQYSKIKDEIERLLVTAMQLMLH
ncbi:M14 family metallocarboxypeptidase [Neobacillus mesonae]|nr:M14 family metallocarboxypeptidase [Neobacillus mesonae]